MYTVACKCSAHKQARTEAPYPLSDMVQFPTVEVTYPVGSFCPPNTFNRVCAETHEVIYLIDGQNVHRLPSGLAHSGRLRGVVLPPPHRPPLQRRDAHGS
jgi:hypothetical protein